MYLTLRCCRWAHLHLMTMKETEKEQTGWWCDDWVIDFPPGWNHTEPTNQRSPFCSSLNHCNLGIVAVGSGTEGWSQVHMEHFDKVALIPEPGEEGTVIGQKGKEEKKDLKKKRKASAREREGEMN